MRILWICNIMLPMVAEHLGMVASNKEGWLTGLADIILKNQADNHIRLAIAFPVQTPLKERRMVIPVKDMENGLTCYSFTEDLNHPENYPMDLEGQLREIVKEWKPDVVHCFGTEYPHTLAITRVCPKDKILIGIQGICTLCAEKYLADLPPRVVRRVTFRDSVKKDSILMQQEKFRKRGEREVEVIRNAAHITGRTWMDKMFTTRINENVKYHFMNETLRSNFYEGTWNLDNCEKYSIFLSQGDYPLKGLHYMLKAMPAILKKYPQAKVYVAGNSIVNYKTWKDKLKISSYGKYLRELIKENGLKGKVTFLGKLTTPEMKEQYLKSHLFVCSSSIENSPNSLGEAMLLGVPCITADMGGVASVFNDGLDGISYPGYGAEEYVQETDKEAAQANMLAKAVIRMWDNPEEMKKYTEQARAHAQRNYDGQANYKRLLEIYNEIKEMQNEYMI